MLIASTPDLAAADGTTNPEPVSAYIAEMLRKLAPAMNKTVIKICKLPTYLIKN